MKKGYKMGEKKGLEDRKKECEESPYESRQQGILLGRNDNTGLCLSMATHVCELLHGAVLLEEVGV
jgi:hypothetical protein